MSAPKQALSASRVQIVREDVSAIIKRVAKRMVDQEDAAKQRSLEQERLWKYETKEQIYCIQTLVQPARDKAPALYKVSTIAPIGRNVVWVQGPLHELRPEMRMALARTYRENKLCADWDACRARAAKAEIVFDLMGGT